MKAIVMEAFVWEVWRLETIHAMKDTLVRPARLAIFSAKNGVLITGYQFHQGFASNVKPKNGSIYSYLALAS
jgi:hypothetical protein